MGDLIHVDTWGPYPVEGYDGSFYFIFFTDDATRFTWCEPFTSKDQIPDKFRLLHRRIEKTYNATIRRYRFDNEFVRDGISNWLEKHGVSIEPSAPYAHHQVGVAERSHRTVRDRASAMMQERTVAGQINNIISERGKEMLRESSLPENLWPEAVRHSTYIENRSPTKAHKFRKTAWQALHDIKPSLARERIWGSRAYVTVPHEALARRGPKVQTQRAWLGYFVGCESESIYRIWRPDEHRVYSISMARIEDGEGLDDPQDGPSLRDREPPPVDTDHDIHEPDSDGSSHENSQHDNTDHTSTGHSDALSSNDIGDRTPADADQDPLTFDDPSPSDLDAEFDAGGGILLTSEDDLDSGSEADDESHGQPVMSEYFDQLRHKEANMVVKRKRPAVDSDLHGDEPVSEYGTESDSDPDYRVDRRGRPIWNDGTRCEHCITNSQRCDGDRPCSSCQRLYGVSCIEPREHVLASIRKDLRNVQKKLPPVDARGPCRRCFVDGLRCKYTQGEQKCDNCIAHQRKCTLDLEGAEEEQEKRKKSHRKNEKGVPMKEKCAGCRTYRRRCDGKRPCGTCIEQQREHKCRYEDGNDKFVPKCNRCRANKGSCDKKKPCGKCTATKQPSCSYDGQEGLVARRYIIDPVRAGKDESHPVPILSESEDECLNCKHAKRDCDGEKPCRHCVRRSKYLLSCTYNRKGGLQETWRTAPYHIDSDGRATLNEDWRETRDIWSKKARTSTAKRAKGQWGADAGGNNEAQQPSSAPSFAARDTARTLATPYSEARTAFNSTFPNGFDLIDTDGSNLMCGIRAVIETMSAMYPSLPRPTLEDLLDVLDSPEFQTLQADFSLDNQNNFHIDQVGALLQFWADTFHDMSLQVGGIVEGREPFLVPFNGTETPLIIWVHNAPVRTTRGRLVGDLRHFSGVRPVRETDINDMAPAHRPSSSRDSDLSSSSDEEHDPPLDEDIQLATDTSNNTKAESNPSKKAHVLAVKARRINASRMSDPRSFKEAMRSSDASRWEIAANDEYHSLELNDIWEVVRLPTGRTALSSKWAFKRKYGPQGEIKRFKARLCARGDQQKEGIDFKETYSAVVKSSSYKVLFARQATFALICHQMDVVTAFLNGELEEEVYIKPPEGFPQAKGMVLRLRKALYGLKQSPRVWYGKFAREIKKLGFRVSVCDPCVFINDATKVIIAIWVDDLLLFGRDVSAIQQTKDTLSNIFKMTECSFYLGMHVKGREGSVTLYQEAYTC